MPRKARKKTYQKAQRKSGLSSVPNHQDIARNAYEGDKIGQKRKNNHKICNSILQSPSGLGSCNDMGVGQRPWTDAPLTIFNQLRESEFLYQTDWQSQKIIEIPVDDMLRKDWTYEGLTDDQDKIVQQYQNKLQLIQALREALRLERLFGGAIIFMGIADGIDDPSMPLNINNVGKNGLRFLNTVSRDRISKVEFETDPIKFDYGRPRHYFLQGQKVHVSRLLIFNGDPLLRSGTAAVVSFLHDGNMGFGTPILMRIVADLTRATGSRQAAYDLIFRASILVFSGDIQTNMSTRQGNESLSVLQEMMQSINNYNAAMLANTPDSPARLDNLAANFGSVPELLMSFLQVLSAASDIPASRFLGQAPGGLDATGDGDLENYYNNIAARQKHRLEPHLRRVLELMLRSTVTPVDLKTIDIIFPPLWNASELEDAQVRQIDTQNITTMNTAGLISDEESIEELRQRDVLLTDPVDFPPPEKIPQDSDFDFSDDINNLKSVDSSNDNNTA